MSHHCHAEGCPREVPPEMLMCYAHWKQIPKAIQKRVWKNFRDGQCSDKKPSVAWCFAADAAVAFIAALEKRTVRGTFTQAFHPPSTKTFEELIAEL